jgi:hypothetical protein
MNNAPPDQPDISNKDKNSAEILLNLEGLVKNHDASIEKIRVELKKYREMLADILANDPTYKEHEGKAKEANKLKTTTKTQILRRPDCADIVSKIKGMQGELKDLTASLSDYLREYARLSGSNEIEGEDGEVREIVYIAKLVKKKSRFQS